jgi:ABC-type Co2+ transport system permease subunit
VLSLFTCFAALVLAVTLYKITRDQDPDLAMLALTCRAGEAVLSAILILATLGLLWLGTAAGASAPDATAGYALGALLFRVQGWITLISATFFAMGSTLFSYLFLRGRVVPVPLAWLGVVASVLLVLGLPVQLTGFLGRVIGGPICTDARLRSDAGSVTAHQGRASAHDS